MSGRRQPHRSAKRKREPEEEDEGESSQLPDNENEIAPGAKRPRTNPQASVPVPVPQIVTDNTSKKEFARISSHYRKILPGKPKGVAFLFSPYFWETLLDSAVKAASEYMVTWEEAIEEFRRLIAIKTISQDQYATIISPTPLMDELWHAAILDTEFYAELQSALKQVLHHRPAGISEIAKPIRLEAMKNLYTTLFLSDPLGYASYRESLPPLDEPIGQPMYMFVKTLKGKTVTVKTSRQESVAELKRRVYDIDGTPCDQLRFIFAGMQLEDNKKLEDYRIVENSTVHVVGRLKGC